MTKEAEIASPGRPFGVSWREGEPETARAWRGPVSRAFAEVRFFRLHPGNLRRICSSWWWHPEIDGTPTEVAEWCHARRLERAQGEDSTDV